MEKHLIWVSVIGGVIGFEPYEIAEFEQYYAKLKPHLPENHDKWDVFNDYFRDELGFREAQCYSSLWRDEEAWEEMEVLLFDMHRAG